jgi:hypothetical protein
MDRYVQWVVATVIVLSVVGRGSASESSSPSGRKKEPTKADAERMIRAAEGGLAPVYAPLAEEIAERLSLAEKEGVGIDLGSGPGTLILELCPRTKLQWVNADINPYFFPHFFRKAEAAGLGGRSVPFRRTPAPCPFATILPR